LLCAELRGGLSPQLSTIFSTDLANFSRSPDISWKEKSMEVHCATIPPDFKLPGFLALSKIELHRGLLLFYQLPKENVGDREESPLHERIDESI
jgi:hypothetical protein